MPDENPDKPRRSASVGEIVRLYIQNSRRIWKWIPLQLGLLALTGFLQSRVPLILKYIIDNLQESATRFMDEKALMVAGGMVALSVAWYAGSAAHHYLNTKISTTIMVHMQFNLYRHLQKLGLDFYYRNRVGEITSRLTGDISHSVASLYSTCSQLVWAAAILIPSAISIVELSWQLSLVFLGMAAVLVVLTGRIAPILREKQRDVQDGRGRVSATMTEGLASVSLIKAFARESLILHRVGHDCHDFLNLTLMVARLRILFGQFIAVFMNFLAPFAILLLGAYFVRQGMVVGTIIAFYTYWGIVSRPIGAIVYTFQGLFAAFASFDRIIEFFRETPLIRDRDHAHGMHVTEGKIEFHDVTFCYPIDSGDVVLDDIGFVVEPHKSLAIVGESGAGKSTIVNLVMRFYDPVSGQVKIDGVDITQIKQDSLREQIGLVMQETVMMSGTIRHNMQIAKPDATDHEIIQALQRAEAWKFIDVMENELDTLLGERGVRLSGGQKQRLSIARVFLKNPPIVVFDEATSALDTITESQIQATMSELFKDRTSIIIAHRLSTVKNCDRIMVLEKGKNVAIGPHDELLQTCARYRELVEKQTNGMLGE